MIAELKSFDQWDRYDYNDNGDFNEADGYIDHFQIVHAGGDQADGDPIYGEDAIWSHRWKTFQGTGEGPAGNPDGGTQIGDSGVWIADYTIQPENGGRSVFDHEYAHDLGLPDDYNILAGGDNPNEHWTLMAQSRLGAKGEEFIGDRAGDLGAWNKLQLGWLELHRGSAGRQEHASPSGPRSTTPPSRRRSSCRCPRTRVDTDLGAPFAGANQWWSGTGDDLSNTLDPLGDAWRGGGCPHVPGSLGHRGLRSGRVRLRVRRGQHGRHDVDASRRLDHEPRPRTTASTARRPRTSRPRSTCRRTPGRRSSLRFHYQTDGAVAGNDGAVVDGIFVDEIAITSGGATIFTDGAEAGDNGWTADGFSIVGITTRPTTTTTTSPVGARTPTTTGT